MSIKLNINDQLLLGAQEAVEKHFMEWEERPKVVDAKLAKALGSLVVTEFVLQLNPDSVPTAALASLAHRAIGMKIARALEFDLPLLHKLSGRAGMAMFQHFKEVPEFKALAEEDKEFEELIDANIAELAARAGI